MTTPPEPGASPPAPRGGAEPFPSLSALKNAHEMLMTAASNRSHDTGDKILSFIEAARATGAVLKPTDARREAQQFIDYWAAEMFGLPGSDDIDLSRLRLASFDETRTREQGPHAADVELEKRRDRERQIVRLAASARMARDAGWSQGYLLTGDALDQAKPFAADDESIRELVEKSDAFERERDRAEARRKNRVIAQLASLLLIAIVVAAVAWWRGDELNRQNGELDQQKRLIEDQRDSIQQEKNELLKAIAENDEDRKLAIETRRQRDQLEIRVNAATRAFSELLKSGVIKPEQIPADLRTTPDPSASPSVDPDRSAFAGYAADFLGPALPMPKLTDAVAADAFRNGEPLKYVNYSVVMNARRRMAYFTASNLDRARRIALPRPRDFYRFDPRLPVNEQAGPKWFESPEIDEGHLVTRQEIAWGPYFEGPSDAAADKALAIVDVYPNLTPQFAAFNRGDWAGLEQWVLESHNAGANRVTIFTGPVLSGTDPLVNGVQVPRSFWKIAVSRRVDAAEELVVDAFLMPQSDYAGAKPPEVKFEPADSRVSASEIENLTGLDFGELLRNAGNVAPLGGRAKTLQVASLSAQVGKVESPNGDVAAAAAKQLGDAVMDGSLPEPELRALVATVVYRVQNEAIWALTPTGRQELLAVLSRVPAATWRLPDWSRLMADVRRTIGDLDRNGKDDLDAIDKATGGALTALKKNVGLPPGGIAKVDFQFAGMRRAEAVEISARIKALGWKVPGEERTGRAAGLNEVRYGDAGDKAAAEQLAADLRALGLDKVTSAKRNDDIKAGNLEIWISR